MIADTFIKAQLAAFAHREGAHLGGTDNMMAAAFVIRNRARAGWRNGNWLEILHTADEVAGTAHAPSRPSLQDIPFRMVLQQIDDVHSGMAVDRMTEGALYYAELHDVSNPWFMENIMARPKDHPRVATVGPVAFFL